MTTETKYLESIARVEITASSGVASLRLAPLDVVALWEQLGALLPSLPYPALEVDTFEDQLWLRCSHCSTHNREVDVIDQSTRRTGSEDADFDDRVIAVHYDGTSDYEAAFYACQTCGLPVTLPDGWSENTL